MYGKLADFIIKRYKLVIIAWLIVLFFAFPLIFKVNDVVSYSETESGLNKLEAIKAQNLIDENFPGRIANSTITIVIQNSNVTSEQARDLSTSISNDIRQASALEGVISVDYVYSAVESYVAGVVAQTAPGMRATYEEVGQLVQIVYGVPLEVVDNHLQLLVGGLNDTQARAAVIQGIDAQMRANGMNDTMVALVVGYANQTFYPMWLPTHSNDSVVLQTIIVTAADAYFANVPGQMGQFALSVASAFNVSYYRAMTPMQQEAALEGFVFGAVSSQIEASIPFVSEIWALGPSPLAGATTAFAHGIVFNNTLDKLPIKVPDVLVSSFINTRPLSGNANTTMIMAVSLSVGSSSHSAETDVRTVRDIVKRELSASGAGYEAFVTGDAATNVDTMDAVAEDVGKIDPTTIILVVFLVGIFFRSLVSPWIPLMTIGLAYLLTSAAIYILGTYVMQINYTVMTFVLVVMLGAGTDYCIFIMSRYREERTGGRSKE